MITDLKISQLVSGRAVIQPQVFRTPRSIFITCCPMKSSTRTLWIGILPTSYNFNWRSSSWDCQSYWELFSLCVCARVPVRFVSLPLCVCICLACSLSHTLMCMHTNMVWVSIQTEIRNQCQVYLFIDPFSFFSLITCEIQQLRQQEIWSPAFY